MLAAIRGGGGCGRPWAGRHAGRVALSTTPPRRPRASPPWKTRANSKPGAARARPGLARLHRPETSAAGQWRRGGALAIGAPRRGFPRPRGLGTGGAAQRCGRLGRRAVSCGVARAGGRVRRRPRPGQSGKLEFEKCGDARRPRWADVRGTLGVRLQLSGRSDGALRHRNTAASPAGWAGHLPCWFYPPNGRVAPGAAQNYVPARPGMTGGPPARGPAPLRPGS